MIMDSYTLAKQICLEMGIEWNDDAQYATIDTVELKEYLLKNSIFADVIEERYNQIEISMPSYKQIKENKYVLAA